MGSFLVPPRQIRLHKNSGIMAEKYPMHESSGSSETCYFAGRPAKCRKHWHTRTVLLPILALASILPASLAVGQQTSGTNNQGRQLSLADQLRVGLKVKTKGDKGFIAAVVQAVEEGRLPRSLVDSTFLWARKRAKRKSNTRELRPIVYFQPALVLRAKKLSLNLPVIYRFPSVAAPRSPSR